LNPVRTLANSRGELSFVPSMNIGSLADIVRLGIESDSQYAKHLDEALLNRVLGLALRYKENADSTSEVFKRKDRVVF